MNNVKKYVIKHIFIGKNLVISKKSSNFARFLFRFVRGVLIY